MIRPKNDVGRKVGFAMIGATCILAALLQWKGLLFSPRMPTKVTSVIEYTKPDGTIVHRTSVEGHGAQICWYAVVPIAFFFVGGAALASFAQRT